MINEYELLLNKLAQQAVKKGIPLNGTFELTSRCTLNCKMCYVHNSAKDQASAAKELTAEQWIRLAENARDAGMLNLLLTGGEVFIRQDFKEIYEGISHLGLSVYIYSNATLIDKQKAKWLGKHPPSVFEITLYGASADTYERLCGNGDAYATVIKNVDLLLSEGINVELKTTVTYDNMRDYDKLASFAFKRGLSLSVVDYLYPARESACSALNNRLTPEELVDFLESANNTNKKLYKKAKSLLGKNSKSYNEILEDRNNKNELLSDTQSSAFVCNAGKSNFWITWDGRMLPCVALEEPSALPLEIGFMKAWKYLVSQCADIPECAECKDCECKEYCNVCPAKLKSETGHFDKPAEYLCRLAHQKKQRFA